MAENPSRQDILGATGHVLVTGGPGCGKTTIALQKAMKRIDEGLLPGQRVLFLSFSRAAVARVVQASRMHMPRKIRESLDVQTFHSFYLMLLRSHGYLLGAPRPLQLLLPQDEPALRGRGVADEVWDGRLEKMFLEEGRIAFNLFAPKALELLRRCADLRRVVAARYPLIVVDEAQDTGISQWQCLATLAEETQLVCLADLDQQIFDFIKDVSPQRLQDIIKELDPLVVDLGAENNRSKGTDILRLGDDILTGSLNPPYAGASMRKFQHVERDPAIRQAIEDVTEAVTESRGEPPESIAVLTRTNKGVTAISRALRGGDHDREIAHEVAMDTNLVALSTRVIAACLEPIYDPWVTLSTLLSLASEFFRAKGTQGGDNSAAQLSRYAADADNRKLGAGRQARGLKAIVDELAKEPMSGNPQRDWLRVRSLFEGSAAPELQEIASQVVYLMAVNRGRLIADSLSGVRTLIGYERAREVIEAVVVQDMLVNGAEAPTGVHVMTIHKSKGKEFDAVILVHIGHLSTFGQSDEPPRDMARRRLLRVGVTRARYHTRLLVDQNMDRSLLG